MCAQVDASSIEQIRRLGEKELILLDQHITHLDLLQVSQGLWPGSNFFCIV